MKGAAIKALVAKLGTDAEPSDAETLAAIEEGVDLALSVVDAIVRIANAADTLAECVDDNCQPAFVVKALIGDPPTTD